MIHTVGIIGYGHFGRFLHELGQRFLPEVEFRIYSRRAETDNVTYFSLEKTAQSDVVILAGAIHEYEAQIRSVLEHSSPETILIDVATVKKHTSELLKKYCEGRRFISTHPMFGPESYKKHDGNVSGFRIVITDTTIPRLDLEKIKGCLQGLGFVVIEMTADEHDQKLAETLFLTHYIAQTMKTGHFGRTDLDTVSFGSLMNAVESVQNDRKLFEDVYRYNPYCRKVAEKFHTAQDLVYKSVSKE